MGLDLGTRTPAEANMMPTTKYAFVDADVTAWLDLIRTEYREMPGLNLTQPQMQRLWGLEPHVCAALIDTLVTTRVLRRTDDGSYVLYED
jgi:hypothetical protein